MTRPPVTRLRPWLLPLLWVLALGYMAFHCGMAPNHVDGGLLLGYLQTMAEGGRPYTHFVDLYGLLSWPLPFAFYMAAGGKVWGLRLWLLFIKGVSLGLTAWGVRRLADDRFAALAVVLLALLLGLPWQLLQTTYAFVPALALELVVICLLLTAGGRPTLARTAVAGGLIGLTLLVKLNSGALLWAGALFATFYDRRCDDSASTGATPSRWGRLVRSGQVLGLVAYFAVFHLFIRTHYRGFYALYLSLPLALLLAWTAAHLPSPAAMGHNLRRWALLLWLPPLTALACIFAYLGGDATDYVRDMGRLLAHLSYVAPMPPLGQPGQYRGFNEFYWPQFTWLLSAAFALWWWRAGRPGSAVPPLFAVYVCTLFVMYSRTDESHLHQSMLLAPAMLAVLLFELHQGGRVGRWPGVAALGLVGYAVATLGTLPMGAHLLRGRGDWSSPRLSGLHYAVHPDPYVRPFAEGLDVRRWDRHIDRVAATVRARVGEGAEVLVLGKNEFVNFASHTQPGGGRYRYLFYLIKNHHLDREGFFAIAPPGWLTGYLADPPPAMVSVEHDDILLSALPEIARTLTERYVLAQSMGHMRLYLRREATSGPEPARARPSPVH